MKKLFLLTILAACVSLAADFSGIWTVEGSVQGYPSREVCTLKQEGDKITGTCKGPEATTEVTGKVVGNEVTFAHGGDYQGTALTITYSGTFKDGVLTGSIHVAPFEANGDFTAKKSETEQGQK